MAIISARDSAWLEAMVSCRASAVPIMAASIIKERLPRPMEKIAVATVSSIREKPV